MGEGALRKAYRICSFCEACCGLEVTVDDAAEKIVSVRGYDEDHLSGGYLCPKGVAMRDLDEDPDRLTKPLVRRGGNLVEASWDEAFAEIKKRLAPILKEHGPQAAGIYIGNPTAHKPSASLAFPIFVRALGSRNLFSASTLDQMPRQLASGHLYGSWLSVPVPDIDRTDFMIVLGGNPVVSNGSMWTVPDFRGRAKALIKRGGRMVVIDPRKTETAKLADTHLAIRPGTDVWLLAAMANSIIEEGLTRTERLEPVLEGLDEVKAFLKPYLPENVADITGIAAEDMRKLARDFASAEKAALYARIGTTVAEFGTLASWLVDVINILTGNLDREGGVMFAEAAAFQVNASGMPGKGRGVKTGRRKSRVRGAPEVSGEFPAVCLAEEIETPGEGQIRALFTFAGNPVLSAPNGARLSRALDQLDFMVSTDIYLNETTRHADVILPGVSPIHEFHFPIAFQQMQARNVARYSPALIPLKGRPAEWEIMYQLALILQGQDDAMSVDEMDEFLFQDRLKAACREGGPLEGRDLEEIAKELAGRRGPERMIDLALRTGHQGDLFGANEGGLSLDRLAASPGGVDYGALRPRLPGALRTTSGKIEMAPPDFIADGKRMKAAFERRSNADKTLVMIGRRNIRTNNSWMHNLPVLAKGKFKGTLEMHSSDAAKRGLESGDKARLFNRRGELEVEIAINDDMMPGVVSLPHGFGHVFDDTNMGLANANPGVNANLLASDQDLDVLSGTSVLNGIEVELSLIRN